MDNTTNAAELGHLCAICTENVRCPTIISTSVYIYIYIERERERERGGRMENYGNYYSLCNQILILYKLHNEICSWNYNAWQFQSLSIDIDIILCEACMYIPLLQL